MRKHPDVGVKTVTSPLKVANIFEADVLCWALSQELCMHISLKELVRTVEEALLLLPLYR